MALEIGSILNNRYRIIEVIAKGGMGSIYRAMDESLSIEVAVKENLIGNEFSTRQFRREATILANLRHPNLPRVTDHFVLPEQGQYLVMDYIEGEDLKKRIENQTSLPEEEVILIGTAICDALAYLHSRSTPIVHRDIKPGNIKITPNGEIFLVDFGIAKISQPGKATTTGAQSLTPGFAPPEQYGQGTDLRSDIYALGATLYMALTGKVPENGLSRMMNENTLTPIPQINAFVSPELATAVEKALSTNKDERQQNAEELKQDLLNSNPNISPNNNLVGEIRVSPAVTRTTPKQAEPTRVTPPPPTKQNTGPQTITLRKKSFLYIMIGVMGSLILCVGLLAAVYFLGQNNALPISITRNTTETPDELVSNSENTEQPQAQPSATEELPPTEPVPTKMDELPTEPVLPTFTATAFQTPVGGGLGEIAYVSDESGLPQIYLLNLSNNEVTQITNEPSGACQPDWAPDGSMLVYTAPCHFVEPISPTKEMYVRSSLFIINADGSNRTALPTVPGGDCDPAWSPDGNKIAFATLRDNLTSTDLNLYSLNLGDNSTTKLTADLYSDRKPAWSPDGSKIVFQRQATSGGRNIYVMDPNGENLEIFSDPNKTNGFMPDWSVNDIIAFSQGDPFPKPIVKLVSDEKTPYATLSDEPAWDLDFSPDGNWMVFERMVINSEGARNYNLYRISSTNGETHQLTDAPGRECHPAWRPMPTE